MESQLCSGYGMHHTNEKDAKKPHKKLTPYATIDLQGIRDLVDNPQQVDKTQAQWLIPSTLLSRKHKSQKDNGTFWALWFDHDKDLKTLAVVSGAVADLVEGSDYEVYTSRSATEDCQKSRVIIPLKAALNGADWKSCQEVLNDLMEASGVTPDPANTGTGQVCYLPNKGEHYESISQRTGELFDPLVAFKEDLKAKQLVLVIEQKKAQEKAAKRKANIQDKKGGLIQVFNDAFAVEEILTQAGYEQSGDTFIHPESESGSYSASVNDGRVHTLSSNDPLFTGGEGGGAHDAFSAFQVLFHEGNRDEALMDAGTQWLTIGGESWNIVKQREYAENKAAGAAEAEIAALPELKPIEQVVVAEEYPVDWPPGLTGDVARYIYNSSRMPVKSFAIAGAIQAIAYLIGNTRYIAESETALNLYQCLIGATGSGKEDPRKGLKRLFEAVDEGWDTFNTPDYQGPLSLGICEGMASGPALLRTLEHQKNLIILNDEYGIQLQIALSNGGASHLKELNKEMLTMYGLGRSYYAGKKYADQKNNIGKINKPYVNLLGTTTPSELAEGLNPASITSGQLNRIIFTFAQGIGETNFNPDFAIPEDLRERLMAVSADDGANIKDDSKGSPIVGGGFNLPVKFSPGAFDTYKQLCKAFEIEAKHAEQFADLYSRAGEQVLRIAGSLAVADGATISAEYLAYAVNYIRYSIVTFSEFLSTDLTESIFDSNVQKALKLIADPYRYSKDKRFGEVCAKGFMPRGKLTKMLRIKGSEVSEVVAYLLESQQIEEGKLNGSIVYHVKV
jgi:hypothetical protein